MSSKGIPNYYEVRPTVVSGVWTILHLFLHFPFSSQPLSPTVHYAVFPSCFLSFLSVLVPRGFLSCSARPPRLDSIPQTPWRRYLLHFLWKTSDRSLGRSFVRWLHLPFGHAAAGAASASFFLPSAINLYDVLPSFLPSFPPSLSAISGKNAGTLRRTPTSQSPSLSLSLLAPSPPILFSLPLSLSRFLP